MDDYRLSTIIITSEQSEQSFTLETCRKEKLKKYRGISTKVDLVPVKDNIGKGISQK